jgi:hypothetical protein
MFLFLYCILIVFTFHKTKANKKEQLLLKFDETIENALMGQMIVEYPTFCLYTRDAIDDVCFRQRQASITVLATNSPQIDNNDQKQKDSNTTMNTETTTTTTTTTTTE